MKRTIGIGIAAVFLAGAPLFAPSMASALTYQTTIFNGKFYNSSEIEMNGHCRTVTLNKGKIAFNRGTWLQTNARYERVGLYADKWQWRVNGSTKYYSRVDSHGFLSAPEKVSKGTFSRILNRANKKRSDHLDGHKIKPYLKKHPSYWIKIKVTNNGKTCYKATIVKDLI